MTWSRIQALLDELYVVLGFWRAPADSPSYKSNVGTDWIPSLALAFGKTKPIRTLILLFSLAVTGCVSHQEYAAERTAQLRERFPPGMSREEVQGRWGQIKPDFSASRPTNGWVSKPNQYIAEKLKDVETSTGKKVESVDRYWGPDGWMSLCCCWYFYDSGGKIVDVEWQYKSD